MQNPGLSSVPLNVDYPLYHSDIKGFGVLNRVLRWCHRSNLQEKKISLLNLTPLSIEEKMKGFISIEVRKSLGIRSDYSILNAKIGALSEDFPLGRIAPPLVVSPPSGELLLGKEKTPSLR